ncbi:MAG: hypothetical protein U1F37_16800 [Alphaproteobacteria bacterium]
MLVVFGNRMTMRFRVEVDGRLPVDRRARASPTASRSSPACWRAGLRPGQAYRSRHREGGDALDRRPARGRFDPARAASPRNRWRTVIVLYCTPENYDAVAAAVRAHLAAVPDAKRPERGSPIPALLGWTVAVIVASIPTMTLPWPLTLDLLAPMILLAFAVATVWLIPLFGYVVMATAAYLVFEVVSAGLVSAAQSVHRPDVFGVRSARRRRVDGRRPVRAGLLFPRCSACARCAAASVRR